MQQQQGGRRQRRHASTPAARPLAPPPGPQRPHTPTDAPNPQTLNAQALAARKRLEAAEEELAKAQRDLRSFMQVGFGGFSVSRRWFGV